MDAVADGVGVSASIAGAEFSAWHPSRVTAANTVIRIVEIRGLLSGLMIQPPSSLTDITRIGTVISFRFKWEYATAEWTAVGVR
jgi:hypothetical protein